MAVVCIGVYVCAALYAGIRICGECAWQSELAEREYADLRDFASSASVLGVSSAAFKRDVEDAIAFSKTLQAVIIAGPRNAALAVEKTPGLVRWDGAYPRFTGGVSLSRRLPPAPLQVKDEGGATVSAIASVIDFDMLLSIVRPPFAAVLAALFVSFFMLIAEAGFRRESAGGGAGAGAKAPTGADGVDARLPSEPEPFVPFQREAFAPPPPTESAADDASDDDAEFYRNDAFGDSNGEPTFADDLEPCLEAAEESGEDLCLLSAAWTAEDAPLNILAGTAVASLKQGTRVFEKMPPGVYAIIPDETVDEGLVAAKSFYRDAMEKLPGDCSSSLVVGLSSRAGRRVEAERLMYETDCALYKAREDKEQPIVAFKADLEKYKAFIDNLSY